MFYKSKTKAEIRYILKHEKIIKHFKYLNPRTKQKIQWLRIKVPREPAKVLTTHLRVTHIYDVPKKYYKKPQKYLAPLDNFEYNTKHDFKAYRAKLGLMSTDLIVKRRRQYNLTQRKAAKVLGINSVQYDGIEHGSLRLEKEWYSKLYNLMKPKVMKKLISQYKSKK